MWHMWFRKVQQHAAAVEVVAGGSNSNSSNQLASQPASYGTDIIHFPICLDWHEGVADDVRV